MGKGDRRTLKGKRYNSSYGKSRPHRLPAAASAAKAPAAGRVVKATKKVVAKKTVVKE